MVLTLQLPSIPHRYKGKVARVNTDGTYDITYDDGDSERRVRKSFVRALRKSGQGGAGATIERGSKIEARFMGGSRWYPGKISTVNSDGSYDIAYDDGTCAAATRAPFAAH